MPTKMKNRTNEPRVVRMAGSPPITVPARGTVKVRATGFSMRVEDMQGHIIAEVQVPRTENAGVIIDQGGVMAVDMDDDDFDDD